MHAGAFLDSLDPAVVECDIGTVGDDDAACVVPDEVVACHVHHRRFDQETLPPVVIDVVPLEPAFRCLLDAHTLTPVLTNLV